MPPPKKDRQILILKIKRGFLLAFCFLFFFIPSQNWYSVVQANPQPSPLQKLDFGIPLVANYPVNLGQSHRPDLTAHAFIVIDYQSMALLTGRNENLRVLPASTVKIMTALVALDHYSLDEVLTVGEVKENGQSMDLIKGEKMTVRNLLYGLLVASANDAALVLAQNYPGGEKFFVEAMNQKAQELNLTHTYFANPTGLDSDPQDNLLTDFSYSTALDLARLAAVTVEDEFLSKIFSTNTITVNDVEGKMVHKLDNINQLLSQVPGMKGVKTGWTEEAGECLVGYMEEDGHGIITVVLGSQDRFGETVKLKNWVFENFRWIEITPSI
ncbi:D-alanyl-D-alanine carboxypeptidase [Candidatus Shapirobacteria bacterium]|nr:D-alanyl-D-alanine carboxypeptidase [Candidatus Shapirobacteria bacterium]